MKMLYFSFEIQTAILYKYIILFDIFFSGWDRTYGISWGNIYGRDTT